MAQLDPLYAILDDLLPLPPETLRISDPVEFIESYVLDPDTGNPVTLVQEQIDAIYFLTQTDTRGHFLSNTWIYSAPKKHGKTMIAAGIAWWWAWVIPNGEVYVIGNDLKQADSRLFKVIVYSIEHHPAFKGRYRKVNYKITLDNGTTIEALPLDPRGEAGMNPSCIVWTEAWGAVGKRAEEMWTEAALSPTRQGKSFKLVESYAGHSDESLVLERLYNQVVKDEYCVDPDHELYRNEAAGISAYWCTRRVVPWQIGADADRYYASEAASKTPLEFERQHGNRWVSSSATFIAPELWDACLYRDASGNPSVLPTIEDNERIVIALDAGVSNDCFAAVGVSRRGENVYTRYVRVWKPENNIPLDFDIIEKELYNDLGSMNVISVVYDKHQLHHMSQRLTAQLGVWFQVFEQGARRAVADKDLQMMIHQRFIWHDGNVTLREHLLNANAKTEGEKLRLVKRNDLKKIDAAVALSMATEQAKYLLIG